MSKVTFYDSIEDGLLKFAVIAAKYNGQWVLCKHKGRATYEFPGGHREPGENIEDTARRELWEETGARTYHLVPVGIYSFRNTTEEPREADETFGMLYMADIQAFDPLPKFEIERIEFFETLPNHWTYPDIQPELLKRISKKTETILRHGDIQ